MEPNQKPRKADDSPTEQHPLFGLEIEEWTPPNRSTVHLKSFAIANDGLEYATKGIRDGENSQVQVTFPLHVPASEWFCTKLAEMCSVPTPTCRVLLEPESQELFFGSKINLAAYRDALVVNQWSELLKNASFYLKKQLWAIYAYDQFIYNVDRHFNNYLYVQTRQNTVAVEAFDFGLSSLVHGWPNKIGSALLPADCKTNLVWAIIKQVIGSDADLTASACNVLDKLRTLDSKAIDYIFSGMPEAWLSALQKQALISWWDSESRMERLSSVESEVTR
ncbi:hypothetical protein ASE93_15265 [Serratia sp. Leaf50]|nr:hypothetical protein ASE93_15265 [Serratia sp. Leaf50]